MQLTNALLVAGALAVSAHPSGHAHRHAHEKRDIETFIKYVHETTTVTVEATPETTAATTSSSVHVAVAAVATTSSSAAAVATTSSSPVATSTSTTSSSGSYKEFCSGSSKRATQQDVAYVGNTGSTYGCNIMEVDSSIASLYNYTIEFTNVDSSSYEIICWNKIGKDGGINGFFKGQGEAVTINLAAGQSAFVAFESNSQGACGYAKGSLDTTTVGEYAGTWVEYDFCNTSNGCWSGADLSLLVADLAGLKKYGGKLCYGGTCSIVYSDGTGTNAYLSQSQVDADGIGLNIPSSGQVHLTTLVGFAK